MLFTRLLRESRVNDKKDDEMIVLEGVTRFEFITEHGREIVDYLEDGERYIYCYQDDGRTVKIFKASKTNVRIP